MLTLLLTAADGGTAWRHQLAPGEARAGFEHVGPLGLAKRLGRLFGLRGEPAPHPDRVAAYAARLALLDDGARSYSRSRAVDPWGVAVFLLGLRDLLRTSGWDGGPLGGSPRLADLAAAERLAAPGLAPLPPGLADVLWALLAEIERSPALPEPLSIRLLVPDAALPALLRRILIALAVKGAAVEQAGPESPSAPPDTDLGRLQRALLDPASASGHAFSSDGSLLVLEADTPLEAAELAAAHARAGSLERTTLVGGPDLDALEAAFARQGLPSIGARGRSRFRPALQILPLRLSLAFAPRDPFRAAELLTLPVSPLPRDARRRLLDALEEQSGIGSPAWRRAAEEAAAHEGERARRAEPDRAELAGREAEARLRERIESWFGGELHDPAAGIPAPEAARICDEVARWAEARARAGDEADPLLEGAVAVARCLARMLAVQPPGTRLSPVQLEQLHDVAAGDGLAAGGTGGEAGRPAFAPAPGDVLPGADEVVWWGFVGGERGPAPEPWTGAERDALAARGVRPAEPGARRAAEAWGWRRPVLAARSRLVLVRWRLEGTAPAAPHPLADEIAAGLEGALETCTVTSEAVLARAAPALRAAVSDRPPAPRIAPRAVFRIPPEVISTDRLSPSSLERLFGCPVAWVLEHAAGLRARGMARIPSGSRLLGTFAHAILEDLVHGPRRLDLATATPAEAAERAGRDFDERVGAEAAPLVARGAEVQRHRARAIVCEAARSLFELLQRGGWRVRAAEVELSGRFDGAEVRGAADLVLERGAEAGIVDLKLGSPRHYRERLERGEALQVALYAHMAGGGRPLPATGYFLVGEGELFTVDRGAFPGARELAGPSMEETLAAAQDALRFWRAVLARGVVASRHVNLAGASALEAAEAAGRPPPSQGPGAVDPPCRFCGYDALCEVSLPEVSR